MNNARSIKYKLNKIEKKLIFFKKEIFSGRITEIEMERYHQSIKDKLNSLEIPFWRIFLREDKEFIEKRFNELILIKIKINQLVKRSYSFENALKRILEE